MIGKRIDWERELAAAAQSPVLVGWSALLGTGVPVIVLALVAALALVLRRPSAWTLAMLGQGVLLFGSLLAYFRRESDWVYLLMVVGISFVLYLNSYAVRTALQPPQGAESGSAPYER
ncbi:MAG: hypothetical protein QJR03_02320 [Sphaerobacter sp.]|nr:hypothetical protein [Sphaerobacter sp.]